MDLDRDSVPAVGWKFIAWSGPPHRCNVDACARLSNSGHVRVDNDDPASRAFVFICEDCYFKIMCGVDPDSDAYVPVWEEERRAAANPDRS